jgi:hypothetical protein
LSGTSSTTSSRTLYLPVKKFLIAPTLSGSGELGRSNTNRSIGVQVGHVEPSRSSA